MSKILNEVSAANARYTAGFGDKPKLLGTLVEVPEATQVGKAA